MILWQPTNSTGQNVNAIAPWNSVFKSGRYLVCMRMEDGNEEKGEHGIGILGGC